MSQIQQKPCFYKGLTRQHEESACTASEIARASPHRFGAQQSLSQIAHSLVLLATSLAETFAPHKK
jgi:hypothetical protein